MSENYIVSARKYRPQTFDTVVGQEHITTTLKNGIVNNHLAHAYLFCGPRGVGKTTCARILARTINCEHPTEHTEACGTCATCLSFQNQSSFNVFELDAASNNSVDDIRELVNQVRFAPQQGKYKIYIIDEVHMLSTAAFNAFLKTLEEPPSYAIFILATTEKHKILPTILSRCQIFDFKRITTQDTVAHLQNIAQKEGLQAEEAALHVIAQKSEGCMRDSLSMLDRIAGFSNGMLTYAATIEHLNLLDADFYFKITDNLLAQDVSGTLLNLDAVLAKGFEGDTLLNGLAEHFRNLLLCKDQRMARLLDVPGDHKRIYYEKANQTPPSFILSALNILNDSELTYKNAVNKRLHVEMCLIRLCYTLQATQATALTDEKKNTNSIVPVNPATASATAGSNSSAGTYNTNPAPGPYTAQSGPVVPPVPAVPAPETEAPQAVAQPVSIPAATPEPMIQTAAPAQIIVTDSGSNPRPSALNNSGGSKARVSKMSLEDLDVPVNSTDNTPETVLSQDWASEQFNLFVDALKSGTKQVLYSQLSAMRVQFIGPDEIRIISPSEITHEFALQQKNEIMDFFNSKSTQKIRITTEIQAKEETDPGERILSKPEIFQEMVTKNPSLLKLKNALGMSIE